MTAALHLASTSAHNAPMPTAPATRGLPQYPQAEEKIRQIAQSVLDGRITERQGRFACWEEIARTDLVTVTVNRWLRVNPDGKVSQHHEDLIARAGDWVARAITGEMLDEQMRDVGPPASLLSLQRVADGASAIGYLRQAIKRQMPNLLRGHLRAHTTTRDGTELTWYPNQTGKLQNFENNREASLYFEINSSMPVTDTTEERVREQIAQYHSRTYDRSAQHRSWELGQMAEAVCSVPPATRPVGREERHRLLRALSTDHLLAMRSLAGTQKTLAGLFAHYTDQDALNVLDTKMPALWAYALAQAALDDRPRPPRPVVAAARRHVAQRAVQAGLPRSVAKGAMDAILDAELAPSRPLQSASHPELHSTPSWARVVEPVCRDHPAVFGPDAASAREFVLGLITESGNYGADRVA